MLQANKLTHAFLFVGGAKSRLEMGMELAKAILCSRSSEGDSCGMCTSCRKFDHGNQEDFLFMNLESSPGSATTQIGVEAVEFIQEQLKLKPYGERHVVVLDEAHLLNVQAQNKLLKTLEEPSGDSVIILLSERKEAMLPTVLSRCSIYFLEDEPIDASSEILAAAAEFAQLCIAGAPFYKKKECLKPILDEKDGVKENALAFVAALEVILRDAAVCPRSAEIKPMSAVSPAAVKLDNIDFEKLKKAVLASEEASRCLKLGYKTGYTLKKLCLSI